MKKLIAGLLGLSAALFVFTGCPMEPSTTPRIGMVHPGVLHTQDDFAAMKTLIDKWEGGNTPSPPPADPESPYAISGLNFYDHNVYVSPETIAEFRDARIANRRMYSEWRAYRNWQGIMSDGEGAHTYGIRGGSYQYIGRDGPVEYTKTNVETDMRAAYKNAVRWMLTGDKRHAQTAFSILDQYGQNLLGFKSGPLADHMLMVGLQGFLYAAAAELIRYGRDVVYGEDSGYIDRQFENIDRSIRNVWLFTIEEQYMNIAQWRAGNQGAMILSAYIAIAIYLDDQMLFKKAVEAFCFGENDGGLKKNIHHLSGQNGETGRDQPHAVMAMAKMALACEIAYKQGFDAYEVYDRAMWKGSEFSARYNLGDNNFQSSIPQAFDPYSPTYYFEFKWDLALWGAWTINSTNRGGGSIFPYEVAYNHYFRRRSIATPWSEAQLPRDGEGWNASDSAPGYSSFLVAAAELVRELGL
ncbi:MAG: alginate lyase family protein [Treponema sp.]|jgi:hypothetical protein|nr:alginate lyase family protein [Treponema sp.]